MYDSDFFPTTLTAMVNLEVTKYSKATGIGEGGSGGKKRKAKSIWKHYFAMQRRLHQCRHFDAKNATEGCEVKENLSLNSNVMSNNLVSDVPMWKTIEGVSLFDIQLILKVNVIL